MGFLDRLFKTLTSMSKRKEYNFDTVDDINAIPIPKYMPLSESLGSPVNNIEYILQRKATDHYKKGRLDLAVACLRKSNEIMPHSNFMWSKSDYLRLVEFLIKQGDFDEARLEKAKIDGLFMDNLSVTVLNKTIQDARNAGLDHLQSTDITVDCSECSSYCKRIFSISGKDKRFPQLPQSLLMNPSEHRYCFLVFYPFYIGLSEPTWAYKGTLSQWSNRPFTDERSKAQKKLFFDRVIEIEQDEIDRKNYDLLREKTPSIAPKSYGGYRRMKNLQSSNFLKLVEKAKAVGIDLFLKPDLSRFKF